MNKKIISLIIALTLPLTFLVGCKKDKEEFYMTEDTKAFDGNVEYSANTYKDAFYSTENYSDEYLQDELNAIVEEITEQEDKEELVELLKSYSNTQDGDFDYVKECFEKYNALKESSNNTELESNGMYEVSSRLYKATLNATKKYYDINDFYIYYKNELSNSNSSLSDEDLENEIRITTIKEYTIASIYKSAYNDSFISKLITTIESSGETNTDDITQDNSQDTTQEENDSSDADNSQDNISSNSDDGSDTYPEYLELTEVIKSQIYDAGVNSAIEYINQESTTTPSEYCRQVYEALENDNPLGENKEEGYKSFLSGFQTTLENNNIEFN